MSAAAVKKLPSSGPPNKTNTTGTPASTSRSPSRTSTSTTTSPNGVSRARSVRSGTGTPLSARAAVKKPGTPSTLSQNVSSSADDGDEDAREEAAALIQDLKEQLQKVENTSEEYMKQIEVLQARFDDAIKDQAKLEERTHEEEERVESLLNEKKETVRQMRELESIYEAERAATMKEKEEALAREEELHGIIQRLKESLSQREPRPGVEDEPRMSRTSSFRSNSRNSSTHALGDGGQFAPPTSLQRSNSRSDSKLLLQKDKLIESLRLELAESQIKLVEMENMGGGRLQELEKVLLETRMANARLMEDNESFQLLLSEKTLNGDFSRGEFMHGVKEERVPSRAGPSTSLADELQSATEQDDDNSRRLESELNQLKDQNKALTLYINKIIERLLAHKGFETILSGDIQSPNVNVNKDLPPPPPAKDETDPAPSLLQRAKSMAARRPRPASQIMDKPVLPPTAESVNTDPATAPSIPLQRSQSTRINPQNPHRRSTSEWVGAANVVNNMYRGPSNPTPPASGTVSPGLVSPRNSFFGFPNNSQRVPSSGSARRPSVDDFAGGVSNTPLETTSNSDSGTAIDAPSPPRSLASSSDRQGGAIMAGNKIRPLRLVQEAAEDEALQKKNNRGSWMMGWFGKGENASPGGERPTS
ncbi:hypothetical protein M501DRAFT_943336 [Patellaria atrata CBS 101060]|uniref:M serotype protein n=1 Tax=Patellaria atrata CBS 101060 TaxID=1346257 RepID=A0A9P4S2D6_9PEZI|nr:hypothetical protein M501DRAFT_943336 [Patellaria atrata CBS 101060]